MPAARSSSFWPTSLCTPKRSTMARKMTRPTATQRLESRRRELMSFLLSDPGVHGLFDRGLVGIFLGELRNDGSGDIRRNLPHIGERGFLGLGDAGFRVGDFLVQLG